MNNLAKILKLAHVDADTNELYIRLVQSNHIEDPYKDVYLNGDANDEELDDESIYRWALWKKKRRIVHKDQFIIPLLKKSDEKDTWIIMNVLETTKNITPEHLTEEEINKGYQSCDYELLVPKYKQDLKVHFHRTRKEQWPLIPFKKFCKRLKENNNNN